MTPVARGGRQHRTRRHGVLDEPEESPLGCERFRGACPGKDPRGHPTNVRVGKGVRLSRRKRYHGSGRVSPDPRQGLKILDARWDSPAEPRENLLGCAAEVERAPVVPHAFPGKKNVPRCRTREMAHRGVAPKPRVIRRNDPIHLRLLQHDLRHKDRVRVTRPPPREVSLVAGKPHNESSLDLANS